MSERHEVSGVSHSWHWLLARTLLVSARACGLCCIGNSLGCVVQDVHNSVPPSLARHQLGVGLTEKMDCRYVWGLPQMLLHGMLQCCNSHKGQPVHACDATLMHSAKRSMLLHL